MEAEVNTHLISAMIDSDNDNNAAPVTLLLTHQLQHLLVCLDVYLETYEPKTQASAKEFALERICSRLARYVVVAVVVVVVVLVLIAETFDSMPRSLLWRESAQTLLDMQQ